MINSSGENEVQQNDERRIPANPANVHDMESIAYQYEAGNKENHYQAEYAGQAMRLAHDSQNGTIAVNQVEKRQVEQVEHVGAEDIADGQVGGIDQSYRTYAIEKFRQRGQRRDENKSYPDATEAGFFGNYVTISSNFSSRDENGDNADDKFNPDQSVSPLPISLY